MQVVGLTSRSTAAGVTRIEAIVDGEPLWFESGDVELRPSAEAYASALLIPAAVSGRSLEIEAPVDHAWLDHVPAILRLVNGWWNLGETRVIAERKVAPPNTGAEHYAQCFTGGVDSYYALVSAAAPPSMLVFAHGFDIELGDCRRLEAFIPGLQETAAAYNARPVVISTNLRKLSALRRVSWGHCHGGALAALGHLLSDEVNRLVIPSSYPYHDGKPWGTHWDLDHLWSSSSLAVEHADATLRRHGKVIEIAKFPLAMRHLRVCWENNAPTGNCSRCEKCVRTMLALWICGRLEDCQTFDQTQPVEACLDRLSVVDSHLLSIYEELRRSVTDPPVRTSVDRLIRRSQGYQGRLRFAIQRMLRALSVR